MTYRRVSLDRRQPSSNPHSATSGRGGIRTAILTIGVLVALRSRVQSVGTPSGRGRRVRSPRKSGSFAGRAAAARETTQGNTERESRRPRGPTTWQDWFDAASGGRRMRPQLVMPFAPDATMLYRAVFRA